MSNREIRPGSTWRNDPRPMITLIKKALKKAKKGKRGKVVKA